MIWRSRAQVIVFQEDMDMMFIRQHVHPFPMQGLPLKGVYRDNLVGIRYLPVEARANTPSVIVFIVNLLLTHLIHLSS